MESHDRPPPEGTRHITEEYKRNLIKNSKIVALVFLTATLITIFRQLLLKVKVKLKVAQIFIFLGRK